MDGIFNRLKRSLSGATEPADNALVQQITTCFHSLDKTKAGLPEEIARYVTGGDNPSLIPTLQDRAVQKAWQERKHIRNSEGKFLRPDESWRVDQMRRLGEVMAELEPITWEWAYYGTVKSPPWLRHSVTLWLPRACKPQPLATLLALVGEEPQALSHTLDILLHRSAHHYGSQNSLGCFTGVPEWLESMAPAITPVIRTGDADMRVELASVIGRLGLHEAWLDFLVENAACSSKKARAAARQALIGARPDSLAETLHRHFATAATGPRIELVETAAVLGEQALPLLADWRSGEKAARVLLTLDRIEGVIALLARVDTGTTRPDGSEGFTAVDGTWVATPERETPPEPCPLPPELLQSLVPAMEQFNQLFEAGRREAAELKKQKPKHWHWTDGQHALSQKDLDDLASLGSGTDPILVGGADPIPRKKALDITAWMHCYQFKHPAIAEFFNDPRLSLYHVVRFAVARAHGCFEYIYNEWNGPTGAALQRRLEDGTDIRTVITLWVAAGGQDYIGGPSWPLLCDYFPRFDEALGLVPQPPSEAISLEYALRMLALFPHLPERYHGRLMLLANDSSRHVRRPARDLLKQTSHLDEAIALQLQDGRQETRALAAEWLSERDERSQVPAIRAALAKERSDLARAAMITALSRMGEDVAIYFDTATLLKEAKAGLAKPRPKGLDWFPISQLPALTWADGTPVDPLLPQWWLVLAAKLKQPGGNALMNLWLDRLAPGQAHRLGWMVLTGWIDEDVRTPTDEEANAHASAHVDATLQRNIDAIKRWPQSAEYYSTDRATVFAKLKQEKAATYCGSAVDSKGILALASRVNGTDAAQRIRAFLKDHGGRTTQAKALLDVLGAIGSGTALQALLAAANRTKQRTVQAHAAALVEQVADRNGWTTSQLADRTIPTAGFDLNGTQDLACGEGRTYRLQLGAQDAVVILNPDGREVKALPGPRKDEEGPEVSAAKKQLTTARKEVKQVFTVQTERLREAMYLQRDWEREEWRNFIIGHPIVGRLAARLIWQGLDETGETGATFRPLGDGSFTDAADEDVDPAGFARIRLAHSSQLAPETITAWRTHLADYAVEPPFDQILRSLPVLTGAQGREKSVEDRKGWMIETFKLRGLAGKMGYQRGQAQDGGWFTTYEKRYQEAGLTAVVSFTGSPLPEENRPAALGSLGFFRLGGGQALLRDVPPVLLAESWQDLHDIADKGTGFDPDWRKKAYA